MSCRTKILITYRSGLINCSLKLHTLLCGLFLPYRGMGKNSQIALQDRIRTADLVRIQSSESAWRLRLHHRNGDGIPQKSFPQIGIALLPIDSLQPIGRGLAGTNGGRNDWGQSKFKTLHPSLEHLQKLRPFKFNISLHHQNKKHMTQMGQNKNLPLH